MCFTIQLKVFIDFKEFISGVRYFVEKTFLPSFLREILGLKEKHFCLLSAFFKISFSSIYFILCFLATEF